MKTIYIVTLFIITSFSVVSAQNLPKEPIKDLEGNEVNLSELKTDSIPVVLSFWATWCIPCIEELNAISDVYDEWKEEVSFDMYAISIDDSRTSSRVTAMVNGKAWPFKILLDPNHIAKRAMNVTNPPFVFIVHKGEIVYSHVGFALGDEEDLLEALKETQSKQTEAAEATTEATEAAEEVVEEETEKVDEKEANKEVIDAAEVEESESEE